MTMMSPTCVFCLVLWTVVFLTSSLVLIALGAEGLFEDGNTHGTARGVSAEDAWSHASGATCVLGYTLTARGRDVNITHAVPGPCPAAALANESVPVCYNWWRPEGAQVDYTRCGDLATACIMFALGLLLFLVSVAGLVAMCMPPARARHTKVGGAGDAVNVIEVVEVRGAKVVKDAGVAKEDPRPHETLDMVD